jgi:hypothetical protein
LPRALNQAGAAVFTYQVGQIGYWAPGRALAVIYDVEGAGTIPHPGLVPLGTIDSGLELTTDAGGKFQLHIEPAN